MTKFSLNTAIELTSHTKNCNSSNSNSDSNIELQNATELELVVKIVYSI